MKILFEKTFFRLVSVRLTIVAYIQLTKRETMKRKHRAINEFSSLTEKRLRRMAPRIYFRCVVARLEERERKR